MKNKKSLENQIESKKFNRREFLGQMGRVVLPTVAGIGFGIYSFLKNPLSVSADEGDGSENVSLYFKNNAEKVNFIQNYLTKIKQKGIVIRYPETGLEYTFADYENGNFIAKHLPNKGNVQRGFWANDYNDNGIFDDDITESCSNQDNFYEYDDKGHKIDYKFQDKNLVRISPLSSGRPLILDSPEKEKELKRINREITTVLDSICKFIINE